MIDPFPLANSDGSPDVQASPDFWNRRNIVVIPNCIIVILRFIPGHTADVKENWVLGIKTDGFFEILVSRLSRIWKNASFGLA
jgi:hypothetical protein